MTLKRAAQTKGDKKSACLVVGYHRLSLFPDFLLPANSTTSRMRKHMRPYTVVCGGCRYTPDHCLRPWYVLLAYHSTVANYSDGGSRVVDAVDSPEGRRCYFFFPVVQLGDG